MTDLPLYHVDAFTGDMFSGNPAAVCLLDRERDSAFLQHVAAEMNLSETAFVLPLDGRAHASAERLSLRWFTPKVEVDLCGHATLATAAVLFRELANPAAVLRFESRSGEIRVRHGAGGAARIVLDFPADAIRSGAAPGELLEALGLTPGEVKAVAAGADSGKILLELADEAAVRGVRPDFRRLAGVPSAGHGVIVTAPGTGGIDFVSRFFAPAFGVDEDPVTGSSHTVLGPYWSGRTGRTTFRAAQVSARGGELGIVLRGDGRVDIEGQAVVVARGALRPGG